MSKSRTGFRTSIIAALTFVICAVIASSPAQAGGTDTQCTGSAAQYDAAIKQIESASAKAEAMADQNPIYISDVQYYASALAGAQRCFKSLTPVATVSR
jgi:hypothetical protein